MSGRLPPTRRHRRNTIDKGPAFTIADYFRIRLTTPGGCATPPSYADYLETQSIN